MYFVNLYDDGRAELWSTTFPLDITIPLQGLVGSINPIRFTPSDIYLDDVRFHADIGLILPAGPGVHGQLPGKTRPRVYASTLDSGVPPDDLHPTASNILFSLGGGGKYSLVEESKPFEITASTILREVANGVIKPAGAITVQYLRGHEEQVLAATPLPAADKVYRSNENYYKHIAGVTAQLPTPRIEPSTLGTAELTIELDFDPGDFKSHFPYNAAISWADPGILRIEDDLPVPANSSLDNSGTVSLSYAGDCGDAAALGCGTIGDATRW